MREPNASWVAGWGRLRFNGAAVHRASRPSNQDAKGWPCGCWAMVCTGLLACRRHGWGAQCWRRTEPTHLVMAVMVDLHGGRIDVGLERVLRAATEECRVMASLTGLVGGPQRPRRGRTQSAARGWGGLSGLDAHVCIRQRRELEWSVRHRNSKDPSDLLDSSVLPSVTEPLCDRRENRPCRRGLCVAPLSFLVP